MDMSNGLKEKLGLLGPDGTFTAQVGMNYQRRRGLKADVVWYPTIGDCFEAVGRRDVTYAAVPILNSTRTAAWINETLKGLRETDVKIYDEEVLLVKFVLAAIPGVGLEDIRYVHSKGEGLQQCGGKLREFCGDVGLVSESSTAGAAKMLRELEDDGDCSARERAVLVPVRATELYDLAILERDMQDNHRNKTRFVVLGRYDHEQTGHDKTTAIFEFEDVEDPGLLYNVIGEFARRGVSLAYLQSIPKDGELDAFTFYCDIFGHRKEERVGEALQAAESNPNLSYWKVLGSYPVFTE